MAHTDQLDHVWWVERDSIAIAKLDKSQDIDTRFTGPEAGKTVTLYVNKYDEEFLSPATTTDGIGLSESPAIPEDFHEALVFKAVQKGYELKLGQNPKLFNVAAYYRKGFDDMVKEATKYANVNRTTRYHIKGHEM
ncbi:MAG: hypothetical protein CMI54_00705 [Parcubacteria group bacterium]|jgi:hypothetical protein|nr:hypothetical protein [Parcubacteria group bacterium]|tara:strand:- start:1441 stop:1848 length:408 start_codon:yes stop_codon:yes gene_type:complete